MPNQRRKCRLADSDHRNIDLREHEQLIIQTVDSTVPGKNPKVFKNISPQIRLHRENLFCWAELYPSLLS